jgi:glutamate-1-semialdehyde 2,1-aminomutase
MQRVAPAGDVYQAGTLSGNPVAMAAGLATLERLAKPGVYERLGKTSQSLVTGLAEIAARRGVELTTATVGGMFGFFFHPGPVRSFEEAKKCHGARFRRFFTAMLDRGIYLAPSAFEAGFVSLAHRPADVAATLEAADGAMKLAARVR